MRESDAVKEEQIMLARDRNAEVIISWGQRESVCVIDGILPLLDALMVITWSLLECMKK